MKELNHTSVEYPDKVVVKAVFSGNAFGLPSNIVFSGEGANTEEALKEAREKALNYQKTIKDNELSGSDTFYNFLKKR